MSRSRSPRATAGAAALSFGALGALAVSISLGPVAPACADGPILYQPRMGDPLRLLDGTQLDRFLQGQILFRRPMEIADGVGPAMNRTFCGACHTHPRQGGSGTVRVNRFGRWDGENFDPLEEYGGSLQQSRFIRSGCGEDIPPEANIVIQRVTNGATGYGLIEAIDEKS